jgi:hypothetical protein
MNPRKFNDTYAHEVDRATFGEGYITPEEVEAIRTSADKRSTLDQELATLRQDHHELAVNIFPSGDSR